MSRYERLISEFTALAKYKGVTLSAESFEYIQTIGLVAKAKGIARALLGQIIPERDGLLSFNDIASRFAPSRNGCFVGDKFILMAHSYYRRGMSPINNWAPGFIDKFWHFGDDKTKKYIALDEDRVRIDVDAPDYLEKDFWYGPPFNKDIKSIEQGPVKLCPPERSVSALFADAYCLDIVWTESSDIKSFQSLEIKTEDIHIEVEGQRHFPARYLHAEFDTTTNCFRHFDGAIQLFTEAEYLQRRDSNFNMWKKNSTHIKPKSSKIFKFNESSIETKDWVEFCCRFYVNNPLAFKCFYGEYPKDVMECL